MRHDALDKIAMGNDVELKVLTGTDDHTRLAGVRSQITRACAMPYTGKLPSDHVRNHFPRYALPIVGGGFYWDICWDTDTLEFQTPECRDPWELVASQDAIRRFVRETIGGRFALGACGYVKSLSPGTPLKFTGSHLNISSNSTHFPGFRRALESEDAQQAMLFFLATSQLWGGIGTHFAAQWELRSFAIKTDVSNGSVSNKGLLQPGRPISAHEVKEAHSLVHYTHYEAGWARSQYQRALAAAVPAIDAHLACHHTAEVLDFLRGCGIVIPLPPEQHWYTIRRDLSKAFWGRLDCPVRIAGQFFTAASLLKLRLELYERLLPERDIDWVDWAFRQLALLLDAIGESSPIPSGPLLGLDAAVKYHYVLKPFAESQGLELDRIWRYADVYTCRLAGLPLDVPEDIERTLDVLFGLNLIWHDFSVPGLYEDVLADSPELKRRQTLSNLPDGLPRTRARRRQKLMETYAYMAERAGQSRITPAFSGFDRIGLLIPGEEGTEVHYHQLPDVLESELKPDDFALVARYARLVGEDPATILARATASRS